MSQEPAWSVQALPQNGQSAMSFQDPDLAAEILDEIPRFSCPVVRIVSACIPRIPGGMDPSATLPLVFPRCAQESVGSRDDGDQDAPRLNSIA
eukprot:jgi/Pico_ML_1/53073/g3687.t1